MTTPSGTLKKIEGGFAADARVLEYLIEKHADFNKLYLEQQQARSFAVPEFYDAGVSYEPSSGGRLDIPSLISAGSGDAEDLVAWRVAELRYFGKTASVVLQEVKKQAWRVFVQHEDGTLEDPTEYLRRQRCPLCSDEMKLRPRCNGFIDSAFWDCMSETCEGYLLVQKPPKALRIRGFTELNRLERQAVIELRLMLQIGSFPTRQARALVPPGVMTVEGLAYGSGQRGLCARLELERRELLDPETASSRWAQIKRNLEQ